jgi:hypothetical protein
LPFSGLLVQQYTKGEKKKMTHEVYGNSSRARCAIYSRDTTICISSFSQLTCKNHFVKIPSWKKLWASQNIFAGLLNIGFSKYGHIIWPGHMAWQASPWELRPSSSAPCAVPMRLSRIDQHIKNEPCAKQ